MPPKPLDAGRSGRAPIRAFRLSRKENELVELVAQRLGYRTVSAYLRDIVQTQVVADALAEGVVAEAS